MRGTGVRGIGTRFALFGNRESLDSTRRSDNHGYTNTRGYTATHGNMETRGHTDTRGYTNIRGQTENRGYSTSYGYAGTHDLNIRGGTENSDITDTTRLSDIHGTEFRGLGTRQLSQKPPEVPKKPDFLRSHAAHQEPSKRHSQDQDIIGFASLPDQVHRKTVKRGFDFTLMVVGDTGLGKSTLINSLFLTEMYKDRNLPSVDKKIEKTVAIETKTMEIEEKGVRLRLTIVDTPGYGDSLNCEENWKTIERYIDDQFNQFFQDESGVNRKNIQDHRVHCCLYFIPPFGHGLRQLDIEFMKRLQTKVNIVPLIAKADALTPAEIKKFKSKVLADIDENKIKIYQFPDCDDEEDEEFKQQDRALKASIPFAVIGSNCVIEVAGNRVRGRQYPWGIVEVENGAHCDFVKLRTMLISTHMQDLKDVTQDVHYETFRARCISQMHVALKERSKLRRDSMTNLDQIGDTDRLLKQKDDEIRKMQDMLNKMKQRLKENGSSSFGSQIHNGQRDSIVNV